MTNKNPNKNEKPLFTPEQMKFIKDSADKESARIKKEWDELSEQFKKNFPKP